VTTYSEEERRQLAATLQCTVEALDGVLKAYTAAASEEYIRMILGQRVLTRGQDIREYRLSLLITHVFGGRLPSEQQISALFQTTTTQSRALLRAVMSKYQYELQDAIRASLRDELHKATRVQGTSEWLLTCDSENIIEALNREIVKVDGTLPQIRKSRGTVGAYDISNSTYDALMRVFP
jgi:hypothetical protein